MRLLVSVIDRKEAIEAIEGGAHIIDVKNPREGSLGANFPRIIRQVREIVPNDVEVSATIGDLPNLPGTASLAALGAAFSGANYVKAGLYGVKTSIEAVSLMREVCRAVKDYNVALKVIAAGYADFKKIGCLNPLKLPEIASIVKADGVMVDVKMKTLGKLFDFLSDCELGEFIDRSHKYDLTVALAGSLDKEDVPKVHSLGADVIGVRRAVCSGKNRLKGRIQGKAVTEFIKAISICER
ncbi:MAG: hypothetical protein AOA66_0928 [Candidatus Bathyarchaeota archaeon BA2]|nr:MAG: hypothetical protein AOA66_0928 [Candidatus Bathyarchaeota archaeon BA2]